MLAKNCTEQDLNRALEKVNKKYEGNITFNRFPEPVGKQLRFTLKVKDSKCPGHRRGFGFNGEKGRRLINACWHVHGDFFDALFDINRNSVIKAGEKTITVHWGNWEDRNIGSIASPLMFSEACDCEA